MIRHTAPIVLATAVALLGLRASADDEEESNDVGGALRGHLGLAIAERWLSSDDAEDRIRALQRLGVIGTARALEALTAALEPTGTAKTPEERLVAVRALARHAKTEVAHRTLVRVMTGIGNRPGTDGSTELDELARFSAALGLAKTASSQALAALGKALRSSGLTAQAARQALLAHPPRDITPVLSAPGAPTETLVELLADLGDQRAFHHLRTFVTRGTPEVRAAAAVALTQLGTYETVELAQRWARTEKSPPLLIAATRILTLAGADEATTALAKLLGDEGTRESGLELALRTRAPGLLGKLESLYEKADRRQASRLAAAIGRAGGQRAIAILAKALPSAERGPSAAYALGRLPGRAARNALGAALRDPKTSRLALRAAAVRRLTLGEPVPGDEETAARLMSSKQPADRAAATLALAAAKPERIGEYLRSPDPAVVRSAASALFLAPASAAEVAAERLVKEGDRETAVALATTLATTRGSERVPTRTLFALIDGGGPAAPLAARALAERRNAALGERIDRLVSSGDPWVRAQAALGLARSTEPGTLQLLESAFRFEPRPVVRRAVVIALARRSEVTRRRTLKLAADLDPDPGVRSIARLALAGLHAREQPAGRETLWVELSRTTNTVDEKNRGYAVTALVSGSLALPLAADADGTVTCLGLPPGPVEVRVAAWKKDVHSNEERTATDHETDGRRKRRGVGRTELRRQHSPTE